MAPSISSSHILAWNCGVFGSTSVNGSDTMRSSVKISRDRSNAVTPHLSWISKSRSSRVGGSAGGSLVGVGTTIGVGSGVRSGSVGAGVGGLVGEGVGVDGGGYGNF